MSEVSMNCHGDTPEPREKHAWLDGRRVEPLALAGNDAVADLIDNIFAASGFNARRLAEGARLYARMLEANATVCVTLAGAMTPIGVGGVMISLIERGFVDFIIATGANVFHDLQMAFEFPMVQGTFDVDDNLLAEDGVARIYDVFIPNDDWYSGADAIVHDFLARRGRARSTSSADMHRILGELVWEKARHPEKSMVAAAARADVPIYTSAPGDSAIGMNLAVAQLLDEPVGLDPIKDVVETTAIVRDAELNGVVEVGGGSPKNFYLQTQPMLQQMLFDKTKGGHEFALQLTADPPHWGGLSGATPSEARSWRKIRDAEKNNVVVYSCASISFPLIAQYALTRVAPRPLRRLYGRMDELTEALRQTARECQALREEHPELFDSA
jgi:deoxyhypusine synthase